MAFPQICRKRSTIEILNVGNEDKIDVLSIARTVCRSMDLQETQLQTTGGTQNGRGWVGDVKNMQLDISRMKKIGWNPTHRSSEAVALSCDQMLKEITELRTA
jgi:UDP-glucose 4-epimerase